MKLVAISLAAAVSSVASAAFVEFYTVRTEVSTGGVDLDQYVLFARFDGATDTVLSCSNWNALPGAITNAFFHKDNSDDNGGVLSTAYGTWATQQVGSATNNRPFDSFLSIGATNGLTSSTNADPSWTTAGPLGWNRADLPSGFNVGWFNSSPPNLQGRVGVAGNSADSVRLGQFVIARGANVGTFTLRVSYNAGTAGAQLQNETGFFTLPAPGAIALLGLAGLAGRRRR